MGRRAPIRVGAQLPPPSWETRTKLLAGGGQGPLGSQPAGGGSASHTHRNLRNRPSHTSIQQPRNQPQQSVGAARARPPAQGLSAPPASADLGSRPRPRHASSSLAPHGSARGPRGTGPVSREVPGADSARRSGSRSCASARASVGGEEVRVGLGTLIAGGHTSQEVATSESASWP